MKKRIIIGVIIFITFLTGIGLGASTKATTITKEVTKEVPVEKVVERTVEVEKNTDTWQQLKAVDDQGFLIASEQMGLCGQGFTAAANFDTKELTRITSEVKTNTTSLNLLAVTRQSLLKKLGY